MGRKLRLVAATGLLPKGELKSPGYCNFNGAQATNGNSGITSAMDGKCLQTAEAGVDITVTACIGGAN